MENNFTDKYIMSKGKQECTEEKNKAAEIYDDGFFPVTENGHTFSCLTLIGQIEGHYILDDNTKTTKYEHIIPVIVSVEQDKRISGLLLILNTIGGDIEAGLALSELIAGMKKPVVSLVLGGAHSIGIPLAVSADRSFIAETASMTVHPARMNGLIMGVPQQLEYFTNMQNKIIKFVCSHSKAKEEEFRELMMASGILVSDFGTVLSGEDAVSYGIIDRTGTLSDAVNELDAMCSEANNS